jgi:hypothetical protein
MSSARLYESWNKAGTSEEQSRNTYDFSVEHAVITATAADSNTARDSASLFPHTLAMNDWFGREKGVESFNVAAQCKRRWN